MDNAKAMSIINSVEPNGELLTTEQVIKCMQIAQQQVENTVDLADVSGSCSTCHYSGSGSHGCNRLMSYAEPKIDTRKGSDCDFNGFVHYLPSR